MSRGHNRERAVKKLLIEDGWVVLRAAGSLGGIDLVALRARYVPRLIEVKSTLTPYSHFLPAERQIIAAAAEAAGAEAWLAWWPARGGLKWIPASDWPKERTT